MLTLQGERKQEKEDKGTRYHRVERSYEAFLRSFTLPDVIEEGNVAAEFKQGYCLSGRRNPNRQNLGD